MGNETAGKELKKEGDVGQGKRGESLFYTGIEFQNIEIFRIVSNVLPCKV